MSRISNLTRSGGADFEISIGRLNPHRVAARGYLVPHMPNSAAAPRIPTNAKWRPAVMDGTYCLGWPESGIKQLTMTLALSVPAVAAGEADFTLLWRVSYIHSAKAAEFSTAQQASAAASASSRCRPTAPCENSRGTIHDSPSDNFGRVLGRGDNLGQIFRTLSAQ